LHFTLLSSYFAFIVILCVNHEMYEMLQMFSLIHPLLPAPLTKQSVRVFTFHYFFFNKSRDSSVGTALGYGLDKRGSRVRFLEGAGNFSLHHRVQTSSEAHQTSYPMGTRVFFPGGIAAGA
jgi:hypothetical protein